MVILGSGMKTALMEAYASAVGHVPHNLRHQFILVGGAALVILGSNRSTEDVDFAVSAEALHAFFDGATGDIRFVRDSNDIWTYICQANGIQVGIEFLAAGGPFAPNIKVYQAVGEGFCAGLGELARMKAAAACGRGEDKDQSDFRWLIERMSETGESFERVELTDDDRDNLAEAAEDLGGEWVRKLTLLRAWRGGRIDRG